MTPASCESLIVFPSFKSITTRRCSPRWHLRFFHFSTCHTRTPSSSAIRPILSRRPSSSSLLGPLWKLEGFVFQPEPPFHQTLWEKASASAWGTSVEKWLGFMSWTGSYFIHKELNPTTTTVILVCSWGPGRMSSPSRAAGGVPAQTFSNFIHVGGNSIQVIQNNNAVLMSACPHNPDLHHGQAFIWINEGPTRCKYCE